MERRDRTDEVRGEEVDCEIGGLESRCGVLEGDTPALGGPKFQALVNAIPTQVYEHPTRLTLIHKDYYSQT